MACLKKLSFVLCSILLLVAAVLFFTIGTESQAEAAEINEYVKCNDIIGQTT